MHLPECQVGERPTSPSFPEVETIRRQLAPALEGRRIEHLEVLDPRWSEPAPPEAVADALDGRPIERAGRRRAST